jgi:hypothetical protein
MVMTGAEGAANIQTIQQVLRQRPPQHIADWAVTARADHWDERGLHGPIVSTTDRASRNVLAFRLANGARLLIRPSGTEPKHKLYLEVPAPPIGTPFDPGALAASKAATNAVAQRIADDFTRQMLAIIGVSLPDYALRLSVLLALDKRLDFVEHFMPQFETQARACVQQQRTPDEVAQWIDTHLATYGKDARGLVREAMAAYLAHERQQAERLTGTEAEARRRCLTGMESIFFQPLSV